MWILELLLMGPVLGNDDHGDPLSPENPKKKKKIHFLIIPQGASVEEIDKTDIKVKQKKKVGLLQETTGFKANQVPTG